MTKDELHDLEQFYIFRNEDEWEYERYTKDGKYLPDFYYGIDEDEYYELRLDDQEHVDNMLYNPQYRYDYMTVYPFEKIDFYDYFGEWDYNRTFTSGNIEDIIEEDLFRRKHYKLWNQISAEICDKEFGTGGEFMQWELYPKINEQFQKSLKINKIMNRIGKI